MTNPNSCTYTGPVHRRRNGWCDTCQGVGDLDIRHEDYPRTYLFVKDFFKVLYEAGALPQYPMCSRVVIDADINDGLVKMYVDQIPNEALLEVAPLMKNVTHDSQTSDESEIKDERDITNGVRAY